MRGWRPHWRTFRTFRSPGLLQAGPIHLGWSATVIGLVALCVFIGLGLAAEWTALLVPYMGASAILMVGLARLVQLDLRQSEDDKAVKRTASTLGTAAATLALGATLLMAMLAVAYLMLLAAVVIAFVLCMVVLLGASATGSL